MLGLLALQGYLSPSFPQFMLTKIKSSNKLLIIFQLTKMLDSINNPGNQWITPLWAPVGLRFHATHHLFPDLPYHVLGKAHDRLSKDHGINSLYGQTVQSGLWSSLCQLWKQAGFSNLNKGAKI